MDCAAWQGLPTGAVQMQDFSAQAPQTCPIWMV
ncbi:hypothetical protein RAZWK3B_17798 [Roseobacter sp. AzwK-3b]|nr:hypothetical protein RAZWK3B_17798 [Roseobacter sp. AzwK-3b]